MRINKALTFGKLLPYSDNHEDLKFIQRVTKAFLSYEDMADPRGVRYQLIREMPEDVECLPVAELVRAMMASLNHKDRGDLVHSLAEPFWVHNKAPDGFAPTCEAGYGQLGGLGVLVGLFMGMHQIDLLYQEDTPAEEQQKWAQMQYGFAKCMARVLTPQFDRTMEFTANRYSGGELARLELDGNTRNLLSLTVKDFTSHGAVINYPWTLAYRHAALKLLCTPLSVHVSAVRAKVQEATCWSDVGAETINNLTHGYFRGLTSEEKLGLVAAT